MSDVFTVSDAMDSNCLRVIMGTDVGSYISRHGFPLSSEVGLGLVVVVFEQVP